MKWYHYGITSAQQYILSAAQADKYRTEPSFKLQGSYRNMNKMGEKISSVMNEAELMQLIQDHYLGEAQLLTAGAEENLLKLAELRGNMTAEQEERWTQIQADFLRNKAMGGDDTDTGSKVVAQLADLVVGVKGLAQSAEAGLSKQKNENKASENAESRTEQSINTLHKSLESFAKGLNNLAKATLKSEPPRVEVVNQPVPGIDQLLKVLADTIENSIFPLVRSMDKKLEIDLRTHDKMSEVSAQLRELEIQAKNKKI